MNSKQVTGIHFIFMDARTMDMDYWRYRLVTHRNSVSFVIACVCVCVCCIHLLCIEETFEAERILMS